MQKSQKFKKIGVPGESPKNGKVEIRTYIIRINSNTYLIATSPH